MLASYLRVVKRRWYVIPAVLLIAVATLAFTMTHWVTVTSRVVVPYPGDQNSQNFQSVATSHAVAGQVQQQLHITNKSAGQLLAEVSVAQEFNSDVYDINVRDTKTNRATAIATAWVHDSITLYNRLNTAPAALAYNDAQQQLLDTQHKISALQKQITTFEYAHPELVNLQTKQVSNTSGNTSSTTSSSSSTTGGSSTSGATTSANTAASSSPGNGTTNGNSSNSSTTNNSSRGVTSASNQISVSGNTSTTTGTNYTAGSVTDAATLNDLKQQLTDSETIYSQLAQVLSNSNIASLDSAQKAFAQVLDLPAVAPINIRLLSIFTGALAILLGLALIFGWEYFDHRSHNPQTLETMFPNVSVMTISTRPSRREVRHVAPGAWAMAAIAAPTAEARQGHWPESSVLGLLAPVAAGVTQQQMTRSSVTADGRSVHDNADTHETYDNHDNHDNHDNSQN